MSSPSAVARWLEATAPAPKVHRVRRENGTLRRLFWLYFWLLFGEGILRKWVFPSLATPLLLIRDPIPLAMLWIGIRDRVFPRTIGVWLWCTLALACVLTGFYVLPSQPWIVLYGLRCDFLHLTVIAASPLILDALDIDRVIRALIYASVPVALLMAWQFHAPNDAWINSGIDNTFKQLNSSMGHVRPPGPFSFIAGPACFCGLLAAVLTGAAVDRRQIARPLLIVGSIALVVAALYSSSRGLVGNVAIVIAAGMLGALVCNPRVFGRYAFVVLLMSVGAIIIGSSSMMGDTVSVFSQRVADASGGEELGGAHSMLDREIGDFTSVYYEARGAPLAGYGLGYGTNAASAVLTGKAGFTLAEREWPRVAMESGPVLGGLLILFRLGLMLWLGWRAFMSVRRGFVLPVCLFGACAVDLASGQFGQTTILGFTMLTAGLCLASTQPEAQPLALPELGSSPGTGGHDAVPA